MKKIEIDEEVFRRLQHLAAPLLDTPNSVIRRVLGLDGDNGEDAEIRTPGGRLKKGLLMPSEDYEFPILEALVELGGSAATSDVMDAIEPRIKDRLTEHDLKPMRENGQVIKWKNRAQFARLRLVRSGDLVGNSPRGFWEITPQGRRRVEDSRARSVVTEPDPERR